LLDQRRCHRVTEGLAGPLLDTLTPLSWRQQLCRDMTEGQLWVLQRDSVVSRDSSLCRSCLSGTAQESHGVGPPCPWGKPLGSAASYSPTAAPWTFSHSSPPLHSSQEPTFYVYGFACLGHSHTWNHVFFGTGFFHSVEERQGLPIELMLASNSQSSCLSLPSAGITEMYHHAQLVSFIFIFYYFGTTGV
jgi:hypothetical protein